jgi:peptidoglycan/LPS O-acetylase OafA/YrhL
MGIDRKPHLGALDGLRFFAAINIVVYHFGLTHLSRMPDWLITIASHGRESVSLFFVLSGFVLAFAYLGNSNAPEIDAKSFWIARLARTYPVYLFATLLAAIITIYQLAQTSSIDVVLDHTVRVATLMLPMFQAWVPWAENWNFPAWALSVEVFFYLIFPFAGVLIARLKRRELVLCLIALYLISLSAPSAQIWMGSVFGQGGLGFIPQGEVWRLDANPVLNLPTFLIGICLGRLFLEQKESDKGVTEALPFGWILSLVGAITTIAVLAGFTFGLPANALYVPAFGLLVYGLAFSHGPLAWVLSLPGLLILGEASYAIYILQYPIWQWVQILQQSMHIPYPATGSAFVIYTIILVAFSIGTLYCIEKPTRNLIRQFAGRLRANQ